MTDFLRRSLAEGGHYTSTQTGNFDLYLPFIEKGISLLNEDGHLGFIAPSLWTMNEYGQGLRRYVKSGHHLWGWIDFGAYQVFDEATTYTALQFFSQRANEQLRIEFASDGVIPDNPWAVDENSLTYEQLSFGNRWLISTRADRSLINRLYVRCQRLDSPEITRHIYQESLSRCPRFLWHEAGCRHIIRRQGAEKGRKRAEARPPTACVRPATNPPGRPEPDYLGQRHKLFIRV